MDSALIADVISAMDNRFAPTKEHFSPHRDVFTARMQTYIAETGCYLAAAVISEIGNNTFDHNFTFADDCPRGVYCDLSYGGDDWTVLADFGRGVRKSLARVVLDIQTDVEAVETAFTKRISGRSPEQRGNGLKFVADTIRQQDWELYFQSGSGACTIDKAGPRFFEAHKAITGCLGIIRFKGGMA
jgi:hypothetical protein